MANGLALLPLLQRAASFWVSADGMKSMPRPTTESHIQEFEKIADVRRRQVLRGTPGQSLPPHRDDGEFKGTQTRAAWPTRRLTDVVLVALLLSYICLL